MRGENRCARIRAHRWDRSGRRYFFQEKFPGRLFPSRGLPEDAFLNEDPDVLLEKLEKLDGMITARIFQNMQRKFWGVWESLRGRRV